ncbi:MAG: glycosyltransferase [Patescibacteria group bacterium]|jgi:hypothetical protein
MKIAYHIPSPETIYAYRTIFNGYKNAFEKLGHRFFPFTQDEKLAVFLERVQPDIFMTSSHFYYQKFLNLELLMKYRKKGMVLFTKIDFWNSPISKARINEAPSLKDESGKVAQIQSGLLGDIFFHTVEQEDERMDGFTKVTGKNFETIPLACDATVIFPEFDKRFESDIAYVGTNLPGKASFFKEVIMPLKDKYSVKFYGQDWTMLDKYKGLLQKAGQYFNIGLLRNIQKPKLHLSDERKIYNSTAISINVHEDYQQRFGGDCNERTFKIPAAGGFEIVDSVSCISKYFKLGEELIVATGKDDWFDKIKYYIDRPELRKKISDRGKNRVEKYHTYSNRVQQIIKLAKNIHDRS